ncbi:MAG: RidA family protein [Nodosilinea sp. LVE1205-7]|jgi:reactive intermediate/imine deaminase
MTLSSPIFHLIDQAPAPVAPYSHAVEQDGWVFVTGQMPFIGQTPDSGYPEGIEAQTHQVFKNLKDVLHSTGLEFSNVVMMRVFLTHFERDYDGMNAVYKTYFASDRYPARTCVGVTGLARGALVEIDLVARRPVSS